MAKTFNHMIDVAFTVKGSPYEHWEDVPKETVIAALIERAEFLRENPADAAEAFGGCDTFEE